MWKYLLLLLLTVSTAVPADEFYRGKTVEIIVGYSPGGGFDTYARLIARHLGRHLPGEPAVQVRNMAGAGSLVAAHYLYGKAKPDGLTLGLFNGGLVLQQALEAPSIRFRSDEFGWVGAPARSYPSCMISAASGVTSLAELLTTTRPLKFGTTLGGALSYQVPTLLNAFLGTHIELVAGYAGSAELRLALQQGEIDGACWGWESLSVTGRALLAAEGAERLIPIAVEGDVPDPAAQALPQMSAALRDPVQQVAFQTWANTHLLLGRPFAVPPQTPPERLALLRDAFAATLRDPALLAEAAAAQLTIQPIAGAELERVVAELLTMPPAIKAALSVLAEH